MAIEKTYQCVGQCKEKFAVGSWECTDGVPHEVESKVYYLADAPFMSKADKDKDPDGLMLRSSRTQVHVVPPRSIKGEDGQLFKQNFPPLVFVMGRYDTKSAMEQYYLERSKAPVSYERWFEAYHTPTQKANIAQAKQNERGLELDRREREVNDLLAQVKGNVKSGKPASA